MGFRNVEEIARAVDSGKTWLSTVHKSSVPFIGANAWTDMGPGVGIPTYQAYLGNPLEAVPVTGGNNKSIYLGPKSPANTKKYLLNWAIHAGSGTAAPSFWMLCDILLYYPLIDGTDLTTQILDNTQVLPRFSDGKGVVAMFVTQTPGFALAAQLDFDYTNSNGVAQNRKINVFGSNVIGRIMNVGSSAATSSVFFAETNSGDLGIKKIDAVQFNSSVGGFVTLVLLKPITQISFIEAQIWHERNYLRDNAVLPEIHQDAALNIVFNQGAAGSSLGTINSLLQTIWE
jgi:hypothetical protein